MSRLARKFESQLETLYGAAEGSVDLRTNQKLFKKIHKFYKSEGVVFTGDSSLDYNMIVSYLYEDLFTENY